MKILGGTYMENGRYEKFKLRNKWLIKGLRTALNVYFIACLSFVL